MKQLNIIEMQALEAGSLADFMSGVCIGGGFGRGFVYFAARAGLIAAGTGGTVFAVWGIACAGYSLYAILS